MDGDSQVAPLFKMYARKGQLKKDTYFVPAHGEKLYRTCSFNFLFSHFSPENGTKALLSMCSDIAII
jgi:hypothetical protein